MAFICENLHYYFLINHITFHRINDSVFFCIIHKNIIYIKAGNKIIKIGLYLARFYSNMSDCGVVIIIIHENKENGGDYARYYQGEIKGSKINLRVTLNNTQTTSGFANLKKF